MELQELLQRLGVSSVAEAATAIERFNNMVTTMLTLTGARTRDAALDMLTAFHKALGGFDANALARVEAMTMSADRVVELQNEVNNLRAQREADEADGLMQAAIQDGRLRPAQREKAEAFLKNHGLGGLKSFLEALPVQGNPSPREQLRQPTRDQPRQGGELSADDRAYLKATKRSETELLEAQKLWEETNGIVSEAHLRELNEKQLKTFAAMPALRAG
jgi:phage I-like protein